MKSVFSYLLAILIGVSSQAFSTTTLNFEKLGEIVQQGTEAATEDFPSEPLEGTNKIGGELRGFVYKNDAPNTPIESRLVAIGDGKIKFAEPLRVGKIDRTVLSKIENLDWLLRVILNAQNPEKKDALKIDGLYSPPKFNALISSIRATDDYIEARYYRKTILEDGIKALVFENRVIKNQIKIESPYPSIKLGTKTCIRVWGVTRCYPSPFEVKYGPYIQPVFEGERWKADTVTERGYFIIEN